MPYLYNPSDADIVERITEDYPEFTKCEHPEYKKVLKYTIWLYDMESDMRTIHADYATRKRECALKAGFRLDGKTNKFPEEVEAILLGQDTNANKIIINYIRIQNDPSLLLYTSLSELLAVEVENSLTEKDSKIIKYVRENISKLGEALAKLEESIFGGKELASMRRALYATLVVDSFIPRPESIARAISEKSLNLNVDPYHFKH